MFEEVPKKGFAELEEEVLKLWEEKGIFARSLEERKDGPFFSFYDGPPFATGLPHYGHLLAGTIKDVVPRYKTMKGFYAPRRFGWDCHGLPIEHEIEKLHDIWGAKQIQDFGIAKFNDECRKIVQRYSTEWRETVTRMGRWVDFEKTWKTMDLPFMETVWWVFKQLFDRDFVYKGFRVMPFSAKLGTPLSNFEAGENYKDVNDPSLTVAFELDNGDHLLIWTTTPWTLISNAAVMVHPELTYVTVARDEKRYILAQDRVSAHFEDPEIVDTFEGAALIGKRYKPPFDYFVQDQRVIASNSVTTADGTGLVHSAPAFGEADFEACQKEGIPLVCPVDTNGQFTDDVPEYKGMFVKDADKDIIKRLKSAGTLFHQTTINHRYPFCWRSDTPLIYRAVSTWFVKVESIRKNLLDANEKTQWTPGHLKHGRFGKWLEGARDWNIARHRYWGTPIPLWQSEDGDLHCVGSIAELEELTGTKITDLHREHIDPLTFEKDGKTYRRIDSVFDCWFESGSMPYAQNHYPFENKEITDKTHPADFIAEGLDQTRGWFYTLTILSTILFGEPAFKNVIVNGILLAEDGNKMSKRLRNYPPVEEVINKYGADAIRLYMLHSPAVRADDLRFSARGVELTMRQVLLPMWNAFQFFITYARIYKWEPKDIQSDVMIDRWILSRLNKLVSDVEAGMEAYDLSRAVEPFVDFVDQLTNWYIRLNRRRFWEGTEEHQSNEAFATLHTVLVELCKVAAPFIPFLSDVIHRHLTGEDSVHLSDFPEADPKARNTRLEAEMEAVQLATSLGHSLRKEVGQKVRQPLPAVHIVSSDGDLLSCLKQQQHLIADELNVKEVLFSEHEEEVVQLQAKPNFRILGKKVGKKMPAVKKAVEALSREQLGTLQAGQLKLVVETEELTLTSEEVSVERKVREGMNAAHNKGLTVVLDTTLTDELLLEGLARELVNKVSTMRRDADLGYTDRITLTFDTTDRVREAFEAHKAYITHELLATEVTFASCKGDEWDLNGESCRIELTRP